MDKFIGKKITSDPLAQGFKVCNKPGDEKIVYGIRFEPKTATEMEEFGEARHNAYELYLVCKDGVIDDINQRVEQCACCEHSHAPNSAPAWIFPEGAMFDLPIEDVIKSIQTEMRRLVALLTDDQTTPAAKERKPKKAANKKGKV